MIAQPFDELLRIAHRGLVGRLPLPAEPPPQSEFKPRGWNTQRLLQILMEAGAAGVHTADLADAIGKGKDHVWGILKSPRARGIVAVDEHSVWTFNAGWKPGPRRPKYPPKPEIETVVMAEFSTNVAAIEHLFDTHGTLWLSQMLQATGLENPQVNGATRVMRRRGAIRVVGHDGRDVRYERVPEAEREAARTRRRKPKF